MGLSRKSRRDLAKLKRGASELWEDQKDVLEHASRVLSEARRQLATVSREEVFPKVRDVYENRIRPGVESGIESSREFASATKSKFTREVLPAVSSALGTALAALEVVKSPRVRAAISGRKAVPTAVPAAKKSGGVGKYVLAGIGLAALAGIAFAAWQTLRADDELWVSDETESDSD